MINSMFSSNAPVQGIVCSVVQPSRFYPSYPLFLKDMFGPTLLPGEAPAPAGAVPAPPATATPNPLPWLRHHQPMLYEAAQIPMLVKTLLENSDRFPEVRSCPPPFFSCSKAGHAHPCCIGILTFRSSDGSGLPGWWRRQGAAERLSVDEAAFVKVSAPPSSTSLLLMSVPRVMQDGHLAAFCQQLLATPAQGRAIIAASPLALNIPGLLAARFGPLMYSTNPTLSLSLFSVAEWQGYPLGSMFRACHCILP